MKHIEWNTLNVLIIYDTFQINAVIRLSRYDFFPIQEKVLINYILQPQF